MFYVQYLLLSCGVHSVFTIMYVGGSGRNIIIIILPVLKSVISGDSFPESFGDKYLTAVYILLL